MANPKKSFIDDDEKMRDFIVMTKKRFLESYSYLTEEEYDITMLRVAEKENKMSRVYESIENKKVLADLMENYFYDCDQNGYSDFEVWCEDNLENEEQESLLHQIKDHINVIAGLLY